MPRAATEVDQAALGQQDDPLAVGEDHVVDLRLDFLPLVLLERGDVDLGIEVADVADDGLVLHLRHVVVVDDVHVAGAGDEDVGLVGGVVHGHDAVAFHRRLQRADRVDLGDPYLRRQRTHGLGRALADVAIAGDQRDLAGDHDVGGALDAVHQRFAAAVEVVELRLGHRIIDVDRGDLQLAALVHLVQAMHAGGGFFRHALDLRQAGRVPGLVLGELGLDGGEQHGGFLAVRLVQHRDVLLGAAAQMQQQRRVAAVVEDHVRVAVIRPFENAVGVIPVVDQRLALDGEHGHAVGGDGGSGMVLGREDVAGGPAHFGAQRGQRLDQHRGLDRHVQAAGDARALERLGLGEFLADGHEARHLRLGDADFLAAPVGQAEVGDYVIFFVSHSVHESSLNCDREGGELTLPGTG